MKLSKLLESKMALLKVVQPKSWDELYSLFNGHESEDGEIETYIMSCLRQNHIIEGGIGANNIDESIYAKTGAKKYLHICNAKTCSDIASDLGVKKQFFVVASTEGMASSKFTLIDEGSFSEMYKMFLSMNPK